MFSLSFRWRADRSLLDLFIRANMPERLVDDFDFFGGTERSQLASFVGETVGLISTLAFDDAMGRGLFLVGEAEGDPALLCRSPRILLLTA